MERGGRCYHIDLGGDSNDKRKKYIIHPGFRQLPIDCFTPNNQPKRAGVSKGGIERWRDRRGAWGEGYKSIVLAAIEWGV